jgi:hypothetical protein
MHDDMTWRFERRGDSIWNFVYDKDDNIVGGVVEESFKTDPDKQFWGGVCIHKWAGTFFSNSEDAKKYVLVTYKLTNRGN